MDLGALVTELAAGAAIAQRAGRVNRLGARQETEVVVLVPPAIMGRCRRATVRQRRSGRIRGLAAGEGRGCEGAVAMVGLSGPTARASPEAHAPPATEMWDAWLWARTSDDLIEDSNFTLAFRRSRTRSGRLICGAPGPSSR